MQSFEVNECNEVLRYIEASPYGRCKDILKQDTKIVRQWSCFAKIFGVTKVSLKIVENVIKHWSSLWWG